MVKKITFDCDFSGVSSPVGFYIGDAVESKSPISFQAKWLSEKRGGSIPKNMTDLLDKIKKVSDKEAIPFEMLYQHTFEEMENLNKLKNIKKNEQKEIEHFQQQQIEVETTEAVAKTTEAVAETTEAVAETKE
jgi:hypothetical protein